MNVSLHDQDSFATGASSRYHSRPSPRAAPRWLGTRPWEWLVGRCARFFVPATSGFLWLGLLSLLAVGLIRPQWDSRNPPLIQIVIVALCSLPYMLSFGVALIAKWHQTLRTRDLFVSERDNSEWTADEKAWKPPLAERLEKVWLLESYRWLDTQQGMFQHALLFGFITSTALGCAVFLCAFKGASIYLDTAATRSAVAGAAVSVAVAVATSFSICLGRILVRATNRDASARMFAWAPRTLLVTIAAVILLLCLLWHSSASAEGQLIKSQAGFVLVGLTVAVLGHRVLDAVATRAATLLNLPQQKRSDALELSQIDGLSDEDLVRLSEEGIDTIHALAFVSTARLYFNSPYSLERICDWQDQALLIVSVGQLRAQIFREKLMVRGAMDAQRLAEWFVNQKPAQSSESNRGPEEQPALPAPPLDSQKVKAAAEDQREPKELVSRLLGFASEQHAWEALYSLGRDERIRRLRLYYRGSIQTSSQPKDKPGPLG
jgi:hypothetical protein